MLSSFKSLAAIAALFASIATASAQTVPPGYPSDYGKIIESSRKEDGVVIYGNVAASLIAPFVALVKERYPWIKLQTTDDNQLWEKYYAESAAGTRTADMMLASHPDQWVEFIERKQILDYASPEQENLPDWSKPAPGLYTASADPAIIAYNRALFPDGKPPMSMSEVARVVKSRSDLTNKVGALDPDGNFLGLAIWTAWSKSVPNAWDIIESLGSNIRPERSSGTLREKLMSGEYALGIFTSGGGIVRFEEPAIKALAGWYLATDGTPVVTRNVAITKATRSPNSARLVLDLMLTRDGQIALSNGGMMPYRTDVTSGDVKYGTFAEMSRQVGADKMLFISPDKKLFEGTDQALERWRKALKR